MIRDREVQSDDSMNSPGTLSDGAHTPPDQGLVVFRTEAGKLRPTLISAKENREITETRKEAEEAAKEAAKAAIKAANAAIKAAKAERAALNSEAGEKSCTDQKRKR